jgi:hypothetical protein
LLLIAKIVFSLICGFLPIGEKVFSAENGGPMENPLPLG